MLATLFLAVLGLNLWIAPDGGQSGFLGVAPFPAAIGALLGVALPTVAMVRHHGRSLLVLIPLEIGTLVPACFAVELSAGHD